MKLSIIIPAYQTPVSVLTKTLEAVTRQTKEGAHEINVVDSSSTELSPQLEVFKGVKFLFPGRRMFAGEARNFGAKNSKAPWLCFLDADCIWNPQWLTEAENFMSTHPEAQAVNGSVFFEDLNSSWELALHLLEFHEFLSPTPRSQRFLASGNLLIHRTIFEKLGGFKPNWEACEDIGFLEGLEKDSKTPIFFLPALSVTHQKYIVGRESIFKKIEFMGYFRGFYDSQLPADFQITRRLGGFYFGPLLGLIFWALIIVRSLKLKSVYRKQLFQNLSRIFVLTQIWGRALQRGLRVSRGQR